MAIELFPSSFRCDCAQELDFFENTIREMKKMSKKKRVRLGEEKHTIDVGSKAKDSCSKSQPRNDGGLKCKFIHIQKPDKNSLSCLSRLKIQAKF